LRSIDLDAAFFIAWVDPDDDLHDLVNRVIEDSFSEPARFVTSDAVLFEVLAFFSRRGSELRVAAARLAREVLEEVTVTCMRVDLDLLARAVGLYDQRRTAWRTAFR
jgi:predicted nucleic acid-binding protein